MFYLDSKIEMLRDLGDLYKILAKHVKDALQPVLAADMFWEDDAEALRQEMLRCGSGAGDLGTLMFANVRQRMCIML